MSELPSQEAEDDEEVMLPSNRKGSGSVSAEDIILNVGVLEKLINALMKTVSDVFLTKIISLESNKQYYKDAIA